ncbi:MAG: FtsX-like permease family protein [candidate division Zixibacteria bacterium]|nr:FtsX-like permease family protein [candidate division Zixibacteria bacterium]
MLKNYIKIALKVLLRRKFFTFISLFGISFTLLILVVVTSFIDYTFGAVPPEQKLNRTLSVTMAELRTETDGMWSGPMLSYYFHNKYVKSLKTPEKISISSFHHPTTTYKDNSKIKMSMKFTDSEFWEILDFEFVEGQGFTKEDVENANRVAVITRDIQKRYFNDEPCIGKYIEADVDNYRVIGIVENVSILRIMPYSDIWVPITCIKEDIHKATIVGNFPSFYSMVLAHDESDIPKIKEEFRGHIENVEFPEGRFVKLKTETSTYGEAMARTFFRTEQGSVTPVLIVLFVLMVLFMILPTINLVNINISRIMERSSEIGVRKAFGASSLTLVGQFIVENIIITFIGGAISIILSVIVLNIINGSGIIPHTHLGVNFRIFYYSVIICLFFGIFSGVYPAFRMSRMQPVEALRGGQS